MAKAYKNLGYPDLTVGDAYKALLLVDEVAEEGEYHEEALEAANTDYISEKVAGLNADAGDDAANGEEEQVISWVQKNLSKTAYVREGLGRCKLLTNY